jgi:hypothetical protein
MDNESQDSQAAEPSIGDLRAMLGGNAPAAAEAPAAEGTVDETPAPAGHGGETEPASEPEENAGAQQARGDDGKFKKADEPAIEENDPPGVKRRIGKALEAQRKAQERVRELEQQLEQAKPGSQPADKPAQPAAAAPEAAKPKPQLKDFETYEEYNESLLDWKLEQSRAADAKKAEERQAADRQAEVNRGWVERAAKVAKEIHTDYDEVMAAAANMDISPAMGTALLKMDRGPEVAYFLAKNPDQCARIAKLEPLEAAAELGAIKAGLTSAAAPAKPAATDKLPKPAATVGGGAAPHTIDLADPNVPIAKWQEEFRRRLNAA